MKETLQICEVGLRDGLQNERNLISTTDKLVMLDMLVDAGLDTIETASFVRPDLVPQMADAREMMIGGLDYPIHTMGLVINEKGYDRAIAAGCRSVASVVMVSETMSQRNSNMSVAKSIQIAQRLTMRAAHDGVRMRVYVSTAWVCPFEGLTPPDKVMRVAEKLIALGPAEIALADTIGHASPLAVGRLIELLARRISIDKIAVHLHDTQALGLANAYAAIQAGVRTLDASFGGLGGCPFAPGSVGNLATEDLVFLAHKLGLETGVDLDKLTQVTAYAEPLIGRRLGGRSVQLAACAIPLERIAV